MMIYSENKNAYALGIYNLRSILYNFTIVFRIGKLEYETVAFVIRACKFYEFYEFKAYVI